MALRDFRWTLEEWRSALFAPELAGGRGGATREKVAEAWAAFRRAATDCK
jgi:hypothetical protein